MRCSSVAKVSITAPGWRSASSATTVGEVFLNAACSSGVATRTWRGRGRCSVHSIALSASQPRCSATWASPSSAAMTAATFFAVQTPPSSGGVFSRSRSLSSISGVNTVVGLAPLPRRRSPRLDGPKALYRASSCSTQRRAKPVSAAVSAQLRPCAKQPDHLVMPSLRRIPARPISRLQLSQAEVPRHMRHACLRYRWSRP